MSSNLIGVEELLRPKTRADCVDGPRPCPWVGCVHHLAITVTRYGSIKSMRGLGTLSSRHYAYSAAREAGAVDEYCEAVADDVMEMEHTCVLDISAAGLSSNAADAGCAAGYKNETSAAKEAKDAERAFRAGWTELYGEPPELP